MSNDTLADKAVEAVSDAAFEGKKNFCERFVRQVIQTVYGSEFDQVSGIDIFAATALKTAQNWKDAGLGFSTQHFNTFPVRGDVLYKTQGAGPDGHVGIYVGSVAGRGDNLVAENSSTTIGRVGGTAKGFRTLDQFGAVQVVVRLPDPSPSIDIVLGGQVIAEGLSRNDAVLVPVRSWGEALGFTVDFNKATKTVSFDGEKIDVPLIFIGGHGYLPIRTLATEAGLSVQEPIDLATGQVVIV